MLMGRAAGIAACDARLHALPCGHTWHCAVAQQHAAAQAQLAERPEAHRCVRAMGVCGVWMRYILLSVRWVRAWGRGGEMGGTGCSSCACALSRTCSAILLHPSMAPLRPAPPPPPPFPHLRGCAHGLLGHLALVHVAGALVEVGVGREGGHHRQHGVGGKLCGAGEVGRKSDERGSMPACSGGPTTHRIAKHSQPSLREPPFPQHPLSTHPRA